MMIDQLWPLLPARIHELKIHVRVSKSFLHRGGMIEMLNTDITIYIL